MLKILVTTLALCAALFSAQPQQQAQAQAQMQKLASVDVKSLDKKEVKSFVKAVVQVDKLRRGFSAEVKNSKKKPSKEQMQELRKNFQAQATDIIKDEGLDLKTYGKYVQLFQANTNFQNMVKGYLPKK